MKRAVCIGRIQGKGGFAHRFEHSSHHRRSCKARCSAGHRKLRRPTVSPKTRSPPPLGVLLAGAAWLCSPEGTVKRFRIIQVCNGIGAK